MEQELLNGLLAIEKPLQYAAKHDFANLSKIKGLESLVPPALLQITPGVPPSLKTQLKDLAAAFSDFDSLESREKEKIITEALQIIKGLTNPPSGEKKNANKSAQENHIDRAKAEKSLHTPMQFIKGVGPRISSLLSKKGINTVEDALYLFPNRYDDRRHLKKIAQLKAGQVQQAVGEVLASGVVPLARGRKIFEVVLGDGTGTLTLKWFHYSKKYMKKLYEEGNRYLASGEVKLYGGGREIIHPEVERIEAGEEEGEDFKKILPVYPLTEGLGQRNMRKIMERVVREYASTLIDGIPQPIRSRRGLLPLSESLHHVHLPANDSDINKLNEKRTPFHRSLVYDEFFFLQLGIAMRSHGLELEEGTVIKSKGALKTKLIGHLPFELTGAQKKVLKEIEADLPAKHPMHRLIQGDVGCGKTMVALISALHAVEAGYQAAIMAPTEILAEQHYLNIHRLSEKLGLSVLLIKGSTKGKEKREIIERIAEGDVHIIIGTHALIQEGVSFHNLGLGIIDEQHRFGVVQRGKLKSMGQADITPNILVMTATPIPRSLAMTVYGDLELSVIDELPPGRQKIDTKVYHEKERLRVYEIIRKELKKGRQAYVVYPLVEESEKMELLDATKMADELSLHFPDFKVGLIHGRMKVDEKEAVMTAFKEGNIHLLVSTTVIEVGIDVPNAAIMVIEHAERFGLSQLHQLRGRVGRGSEKSLCILLAQYQKSDEARERLHVMEKSSSGFDISEADLKIRGPGDFLGTRQSGMPDFRIGNILKDERILKEAREDAFQIISTDPELKLSEHEFLRDILKERWQGRLGLAGIG
ncbi:MAG: ATP-dependent DNA helicase RecG [Deltaproteobacteria bacterium]|nr:ATP-dependent DNA helicase RecG [Deltaproteobacteria bacterium]